MNDPRHPDITVQLTGQDGNGFAIIGAVQRALRAAGEDRTEFTNQAFGCGSYDELLSLVMSWVNVE